MTKAVTMSMAAATGAVGREVVAAAGAKASEQ